MCVCICMRKKQHSARLGTIFIGARRGSGICHHRKVLTSSDSCPLHPLGSGFANDAWSVHTIGQCRHVGKFLTHLENLVGPRELGPLPESWLSKSGKD